MKLETLLIGCQVIDIINLKNIEIESIVFDSRKADENSIFVAIKGTQVDGHNYIQNVIEQGCKVIITQNEINVPGDICFILVKDTSESLGIVSANLFDNPSNKLRLIGILIL